jgi:hypothetical protein
MSETPDTHTLLADLKEQITRLSERVGEPAPDGRGGTGLIGDVASVKADVAALKSLRDRGLGALAAITLLGAILVLGFKTWVAQIAKAAA